MCPPICSSPLRNSPGWAWLERVPRCRPGIGMKYLGVLTVVGVCHRTMPFCREVKHGSGYTVGAETEPGVEALLY